MVGTIKVGKLQAADGTGNTISLESGHKLSGAAGSLSIPGVVVQTSFHTFSDITSVTSSSYSDVGGSSFTFTHKFATSLLKITASVHCYTYRSSTNNGGSVDINVDGSNISASGDAREYYIDIGGANNQYCFSRQHKEVTVSASNTSAKTIKLQMKNYDSDNSGGFRINDGAEYRSSIKVEEVSQ